MNIPRLALQQMVTKLGTQKVLMLYGTHRTGKTTIIENIVSKYPNGTGLMCFYYLGGAPECYRHLDERRDLLNSK